MKRLITFWIILFTLVTHSYAATYYAASGGTNFTCAQANNNTNQPRNSLTNGLSCLAGGDTLILKSGVYAEKINNGQIPNGNSGSYTTIKSETPLGAVLRPGSTFDIVVNNGSFFRLQDLTLDGNNVTTGYAIRLVVGTTGAHDVEIIGNDIKNIAGNNNANNSGGISLGWHQTNPNILIQGNKIHDLGMNDVPGECSACYTYATYFSTNGTTFENNEVYNTSGYGIHMYDGCAGSMNNNTIRNNIFRNTGTILIGACGTGNKVYNNVMDHLVSNPNGMPYDKQAVRLGSGDEFTNNTIAFGGTTPGTAASFCIDTGSGSVVRNNICYNYATNSINGGGSNVSNNLCFPSSGSCQITGNPQFVNESGSPPDYHLTASSPAVNAGATTGTGVDIEGHVRNVPYDVGAYEVVSAAVPGTYYVAVSGGDDTRSCLQSKNISTPKQHLTGVNGGLACAQAGAGDIIYLREGTYNERIDSALQTILGGTSFANPLIIAAYQSEVVTLTPTGLASNQAVVNLAASNNGYIVFDKIKLNAGTTGNNGLRVADPAHHVRFQNGEIAQSLNGLVEYAGCNGCELIGNKIHNNGANWGCVFLQGGTTNTLISRNIFHHYVDVCILDEGLGPRNANNIVNANTFTNATTASGSVEGVLYTGRSDNLKFTNNLICAAQPNIINGVAGTSTGVKFYNNTIKTTTSAINIASGNSSFDLKNNILTGTVPITNNGTGTTFGKNICPSAGTGCEIVGDPLFIDSAAGNFHLQNCSPAREAGLNLVADVPFDFAGVQRPQGTGFEIGIYEETPAICGQQPTPPVMPRPFPLWFSR